MAGQAPDSPGSDGAAPSWRSCSRDGAVDAPALRSAFDQRIVPARREGIALPSAILGGEHDRAATKAERQIADIVGAPGTGEDPDEQCVDLLPAAAKQRCISKRQLASGKAGAAVRQERP